MAIRSAQKKKNGKGGGGRQSAGGRRGPPPPKRKPVESESSDDASSGDDDGIVEFRGGLVGSRSAKKKAVSPAVKSPPPEEEDSAEPEGSDDDDGDSTASSSVESPPAKKGKGGKKSAPKKSAPKKSAPKKSAPKKDEDSTSGDDDDDSPSDDDSGSDDDESDDGDDGKALKKGFSDENAAWLKPKKQQLMSSDEDGSGEDESEDDDDEMLEVERQALEVDREEEEERVRAEEEMSRTIRAQTSVFHLPTPEELAEDEDRVVPPGELRERIEAVLEVLAEFKARREPGRARSDYVDRVVEDMAELHGYLPELVEHFASMLGPAETLEFLRASDRPRPLVIRTNTLKARRKELAASLLKRGVTLDPLAGWSKVGLKIIESPVPVGATPEYLAGHYMVQSAASLCPVLALDPKPGERNLDMSAAPGGKTSYMSQLMRNTGSVIANDLKKERQKATVANLHRLGVRNAVTCVHDGRKLGKMWGGKFDRVLLDAPCSGLGVASRDPSVKVQRTIADVRSTAALQKELLLSAIDALSHRGKGGGFMVYSTCSVSVLENEEVVDYALAKRNIRVVDAGLDFGKPGMTKYMHKRFHPSLSLTRRFYPHVHNMDGFYVAKLQKLSDKIPGEDEKKKEDEEEAAEADSEDEEESGKGKGRQGKKNAKKGGVVAPGAKKGPPPAVKRDRGGNGAEGAGVPSAKRVRKDKKVSHPPARTAEQGSKKKSKKKDTSAKMTKPRRQKVAE